MDSSTGLSLSFFIILLLAGGYLLYQMVRIVPQGEEWIIERLGKFHTVLKPGLNFLIPVFDKVQMRLNTKELIQQMKAQEVITKDNAVVIISAVVFYKISDPAKAVYSIDNFELAVANMAATTLRSVIGNMELDTALSGREIIKSSVSEKISDHLEQWGLSLTAVEVQDIRPSDTLQEAMEKQAAAQREKKALIMKAEGEKQAAITKAEGFKQSLILEAEGKYEASKKEAEAKVALANGDKEAMVVIASQIKVGDAASYLLAQRYIDSVMHLGNSNNSKVVFIPTDLKHSLEGATGGLGTIFSQVK
ncbi:SPFH/Band 7/PHB domain protein [Sulfurospirillum diekertiae]|jgi:regulator of protease activity HflC (stomatin/prohibitin superfamily)|uniref:SPFH/Band 7/PHB domain protein n=1 Tax=Sulfurospirillum diekertiae TaxID=1854492 RepID=A0A6G9VQU1_9BACT|nr:SPFH domain-containing protein [Sulfurospirillum diekertiae]QIR75264.1 SPFH/Band 7/PHB domain protein [Sulfurospirillum diekertiae]QIR77916.1 SPFH/Band 7/PHB domain protein [Sulfurospirillum diekertiae]